MQISNEAGRALLAGKGKKKSREGNRLTEYNGNTYHSAKEARCAKYFDLMVQVGELTRWERQVPFKCEIQGIHLATYICDFVCYYPDGRIAYRDAKGRKSGGPYQMFKLKVRLVRLCFGIEVEEI